jgi:hypothetical protein
MPEEVKELRPTSTPSRRRARIGTSAPAPVAIGLGVGGCGPGQQTPTAQQVATVNGSNTGAGAIALRNVYLDVDPADPHPTAPVFTAIKTSDRSPDPLVSITSAAVTVTLTAPPGVLRRAPDTAALRLDETMQPALTTAFILTFVRAGAVTVHVPFDVITPPNPFRPTAAPCLISSRGGPL